MYYSILQLAINSLHLAHINILDWISVFVQFDRSARGVLQFYLIESLKQFDSIFNFTIERLDRLLYP